MTVRPPWQRLSPEEDGEVLGSLLLGCGDGGRSSRLAGERVDAGALVLLSRPAAALAAADARLV